MIEYIKHIKYERAVLIASQVANSELIDRWNERMWPYSARSLNSMMNSVVRTGVCL